MFQTKVVEKIKAHVLCPTTFLPKIVLFMRQLWKVGRAGQSTDDNKI
jgi:hypothetical protein